MLNSKPPRISEGVSDGLVQVPPLPISFPLSNGPAPKQKEASGIERRKSLIRAYLSKVPRQHGLYRLDFRLSERSRRLGTFLLEQVGNEPESQIYTPSSKRMYSEEVLQLARFWIRKCLSQEHEKCPDENFNNPRNRYWPTRLIELPPHDPTKHDINTGKLEKVRLVAGKDAARIATEEGALRLIHAGLPDRGPGRSGEPSAGANSGLTRSDTVAPPVRGDPETDPSIWQYVTLSHCWGKQRITRLLKENKDDFEKEIPISTLPQTFRDAIEFARRLDRKVRYLWIDSLCIVQDNNDDWARESVQMYEVYRNSYCNISATAACDSHQGIYNKSGRDPQLLWEDEINLNVDGIPGAHSPRKAKHEIGFEAPIRRCTIRDLSFWDRKVDDASVNKRAWVLQERLLAPRVLHFCEDQIAWECSHLDAAESLPHGVSKMELKSGEVKERVRLKSLVPDDFGPKPIEIDAMRTSYAAHEDWKRIVERYSRTRLTLAKDKLIALAGITQMMATRISGLYVAGLWEQYLASQLLWRVNPVYAQSHEDDPTYEDPREEDEVSSGPVSNHLKNKSKRPKRYRAPTFSWAAVDAPQGVELGTWPLITKENWLEFSYQLKPVLGAHILTTFR